MTVGVIGAGTMGCGVAHIFAESGCSVILYDIDHTHLEHAAKQIKNTCRFRQLQGDSEYIDSKLVMEKIHFTNDMLALEETDFIVENIVEDVNIKKTLYCNIDKIAKHDTIIAANTSCISVTQLGSYTSRPDKVIGIHFMNPVAQIMAVEVIRGLITSPDTMSRTLKVLDVIHKESIVVNDSPGFVSNRISHLMMNEAAFLAQEKCASPKDIDAIFVKCYGHKMGPLETADLIGLDTVVDSLNVLYQSFQDPKFRCCPLLINMVHANRLGRKTGEGFFVYV